MKDFAFIKNFDDRMAYGQPYERKKHSKTDILENIVSIVIVIIVKVII